VPHDYCGTVALALDQYPIRRLSYRKTIRLVPLGAVVMSSLLLAGRIEKSSERVHAVGLSMLTAEPGMTAASPE
jgi:hypothetical protein